MDATRTCIISYLGTKAGLSPSGRQNHLALLSLCHPLGLFTVSLELSEGVRPVI